MDRAPEAWRVIEDVDPDEPGPPDARKPGPHPLALILAATACVLAAGALGVSVLSSIQGSGTGAGVHDPSRSVEVLTAATPSPGMVAAASPAAWLVDVAGAVRRPGLYHLPPGSRVGDAIAAAGGFGPRVDTTAVAASLNLAEELRDGAKVVVPERGAAVPGASQGVPARGGTTPAQAAGGAGPSLVDLNSASASELDTLPGIGPVTAAKIIASRASEPFRSVDDLLARKLVHQNVMDQIRGLVRIGG